MHKALHYYSHHHITLCHCGYQYSKDGFGLGGGDVLKPYLDKSAISHSNMLIWHLKTGESDHHHGEQRYLYKALRNTK